jgi:hypothetical protein
MPIEYDRRLLASKIDWEGGIIAALEYGVSSAEISDPDLRIRWEVLELLWAQMRPLIREFDRVLRGIEKEPGDAD